MVISDYRETFFCELNIQFGFSVVFERALFFIDRYSIIFLENHS